jgi:hypothetical protein
MRLFQRKYAISARIRGPGSLLSMRLVYAGQSTTSAVRAAIRPLRSPLCHRATYFPASITTSVCQWSSHESLSTRSAGASNKWTLEYSTRYALAGCCSATAEFAARSWLTIPAPCGLTDIQVRITGRGRF